MQNEVIIENTFAPFCVSPSSHFKNADESVEFFIPKQGLDLDHYLSIHPIENACPGANEELIQAIHHLARYYWAIEVLNEFKGLRILDIATGSGYGAHLLAQALPTCSIVGSDYDERAIEYAVKNHGGIHNLKFRRMDIISWASPEAQPITDKFDVIISFDTIEHLHHRELALINLSENLTTNGILLLSTPINHEPLLNPPWEHHKIEYNNTYLLNLLKRFFAAVRIPDNNTLPGMDFWRDRVNSPIPRYWNFANPIFCQFPIQHGL